MQKFRTSWLNGFGTINKTYTGIHTNKHTAGHKLYLKVISGDWKYSILSLELSKETKKLFSFDTNDTFLSILYLCP